MPEKLIITHTYYKASNGQNAGISDSIERIDSAHGEKVAIQALVLTDGKSGYFCTDSTPSLGILPYPTYRLEIDSPLPFTIRPVGYIEDNNGIKHADIIFDQSTLFYTGDTPICAYIEFDTSYADITDYTLSVSLYIMRGLSDEQLITKKTITLYVHNVRLPKPLDYSLYLDIWQHNSNIARTYGVKCWSDEHFRQISKVLDALKELGQKSITLVVSDAPWRGWGCNLMRDYPANLFEYNIVSVECSREGRYSYDYTAMDKYISLCKEKDIFGDISIYGLLGIWKMPYFTAQIPDYPEAVMIRYKDYDGCYKYMQTQADITDYVAALIAHLKSIEVWDRVRIAADEPSDLTAFNKNLDILKSIAPDIKLKMAIDKESVIESHGSMLADIAYSYPCALNATSKSDARRLWYVCNVPDKPNSLLHNSLIDTFILAPLNYKLGFDGLLRWAFTCWTQEPLKDIRYNINGLPAGDMYLVYPSKNGELYPSLRYKALEKGVVFYELLLRLKKTGKAEIADEIINSLIISEEKETFSKAGENLYYSTTPIEYLSAYAKILSVLEEKGA